MHILISATFFFWAEIKAKTLDLQLKRLVHDSDAMLQKLDAETMPLVK